MCAVAKGADSHVNEALIRLAFKGKQPAATAQVQKIRDAFRAADATFEMQGNDRELQVLAATTLAILMHNGGDQGAEAALSVTTTALAGTRKPDLPMDLAVLAEGAIAAIAEAQRKRPNLGAELSAKAPKFDFEKSAAKVREAFNADGVIQAFNLCAETVRAALGQLAARQAEGLRGVDRFLRVQDEELQMLWWLIGQRSVDLNCSFEDVPPEARAPCSCKGTCRLHAVPSGTCWHDGAAIKGRAFRSSKDRGGASHQCGRRCVVAAARPRQGTLARVLSAAFWRQEAA